MATFTWVAGTTADWSATGVWTPPTKTAPGTTAASKDVVNFLAASTGNKDPYVISLKAAESFDVGAIDIGAAAAQHASPSLSITGSLFTDTLAYTASVRAVNITINAGGLFDIRTGITNASGFAETMTIAGTGTGGHLDLGSATQSGIGVNEAHTTLSFSNNPDGNNTGVFEYLSGFNAAGTTTNQHIGNFAGGDAIIFDGANFNGDTFSYVGTTLTVKDGGTTVLTMNNLSGAGLTSSSFLASGNEIVGLPPVGALTWTTATSGNWNTPADWKGGNNVDFPGSAGNTPSDSALINATGDAYTVHENVTANTIAALTLNSAKATLAFDQAAAAALTVSGATILTLGTISVASAAGTLNTGTLSQTGGTYAQTAGNVTVAGLAALTTGVADSISGGTFNAGTLAVGTNLAFGPGTIKSTAAGVTIAASSTVTMSAPSDLNATIGGLTLTGNMTGSGAVDGAISGAGHLTASGGRLDLTGTVNGPVLAIANAANSDLKIDGTAASAAAIGISNATQMLEVGAAGALTIGAAQAVNAGAIKMSGGTLTDAKGIDFQSAGKLSGFGTVAANLTLTSGTATVTASGGTLGLTGTLGSGIAAAIGTSSASDLKFDNTATVATLADLTAGTQTLEVGAAGSVSLTSKTALTVSLGTIRMDGGALTDAAGIILGTLGAGTLIGFGTVNADVTQLSSPSKVEASGGTLFPKREDRFVPRTGLRYRRHRRVGPAHGGDREQRQHVHLPRRSGRARLRHLGADR